MVVYRVVSSVVRFLCIIWGVLNWVVKCSVVTITDLLNINMHILGLKEEVKGMLYVSVTPTPVIAFLDKNLKIKIDFQPCYQWIQSHKSFTEWFFVSLRTIVDLIFLILGSIKFYSQILSICWLLHFSWTNQRTLAKLRPVWEKWDTLFFYMT